MPDLATRRTLGENDCRRAQGCAHSSRTSRSAKSLLPTRSREALERLTEEAAEADRRFITALTISNAHGGLPARILRLSPKSRPALTIRRYYLSHYQI